MRGSGFSRECPGLVQAKAIATKSLPRT